jgi:selenocysteine lyase/cysteine desulfurase
MSRPTGRERGGSVVPGADYAADFVDMSGVTYLNCAYHGPLPKVAVEAAHAATDLKARPHRIRDAYHYSFPDAYRRAVARLLGCDPTSIAVADSATLGVMIIVNGLDWRRGDEVILPHGEFPANLFPWRSLEARGVVVRQIEVDDPDGLARVESTINARTRVVSASWVSYTTGVKRDLWALGELCRVRGVLFVVDASQGIGGLPFDLRQTPCDLVACAGYKWLLGPYGLGFAYVAPELIERLTPGNVNWFAIDGARDFNRLSRCELAFEPGARRFDINEAANFINTAAGTASVRYITRVTPDAVRSHVSGLIRRLLGSLPPTFHVVGPTDSGRRSNIVRLAAEEQSKTAMAFRRLRERGVIVSLREGAIRISPHLYNDEADIEQLLDGLALGEKRHAKPAPLPVGEPVPGSDRAGRLADASYRGRWIALHAVDPEQDVDDLYAAAHGSPQREAVWTYMPYGPFADREEMLAWLQECARSSDPLFRVVHDNASARRIGMVSFLRIDETSRCLELGHIWGPTHQCQHGSRVLDAVGGFRSSWLQARRVEM